MINSSYFSKDKHLLRNNVGTITSYKTSKQWGSGCESVDRVVASYTKSPWFESSHQQKNILNMYFLEKTKIKKKKPGMAHFISTVVLRPMFLKSSFVVRINCMPLGRHVINIL